MLTLLLLGCLTPLSAGVVQHSGTISTNETWSAADVHVVEAPLTVASLVQLTLEPGTVVKCVAGAGITVEGILSAIGTSTEPIVITSLADDDHGGDSNGDGVSTGSPGDWDALRFNVGSGVGPGQSRLEHVQLFFGGASTAALVLAADLQVDELRVEHSASNGIYLVGPCSPSLSHTRVEHCGLNGIYLAKQGIEYPNLNLSTSFLLDNPHGFGVYADDWHNLASISETLISGNKYPLRLGFLSIPNTGEGNDCSGNLNDCLFIIRGSRYEDLTVQAGMQLYSEAFTEFSGKVTLPAGTVWKVKSGPLRAQGQLIAVGTSLQPIIFTSDLDNTVGYPLNETSSAPTPGSWDGLYFEYTSYVSSLSYCQINYASQGIYAYGTPITMDHSKISNCVTGFSINEATLSLDHCQVFANTYGLNISSGDHAISDSEFFLNHTAVVNAGGANSTMAQSHFYGNLDYAYVYEGPSPLSLASNYWGASTGPNGGGVSGGGQSILVDGSGSLDATNFLTSGPAYAFFDAGGSLHSGQGLSQPVFTLATANIDAGAAPFYSYLENATTLTMDAVYSGLPAWPEGYRVHIVYFNPGAAAEQTLSDGANNPIHGPLMLPSQPQLFSFDIPPGSIDGSGMLTLRFTAVSGESVKVAAIMLAQIQPASGAISAPAPPVVLNFPTGPDSATAPRNFITTSLAHVLGSRDANSAVLLNGTQIIPQGIGDWDYDQALTEGDQLLMFSGRNPGGDSDPVYLMLHLDTVPPQITSVQPAAGAVVGQADGLHLGISELNGIDLNASNLELVLGATPLNGSWSVTSDSLSFTPDQPFSDGIYQLTATLVDGTGNAAQPFSSSFELDTIAPLAPTVDAYPSLTAQASLVLTGGKEAGASLELDGQEVIAASPATSWSYQVELTQANNSFAFTQIDRASNSSPATQVTIERDVAAPPAVALSANGAGQGTRVALEWHGYDESAVGDVVSYRIYRDIAPFSDVAARIPLANQTAGAQSYSDVGLARSTTYYYAVVAVDLAGNADSAVSATAVTTSDILAPADPSSLSATAGADALNLSWTAPIDLDADLAGYKISLDGSLVASVTAPTTSFSLTGLNGGSTYTYSVASYDADGNTSAGTSGTSTTLLENPSNLVATQGLGSITLSWSAATPANQLKQYKVYMATSDFSSVIGKTATRSLTATTTTLTGLTDGTIYYFAVTAVNLSNGEAKTVATISATPTVDEQGPSVNSVKWNGSELPNGATLTGDGSLLINASDPSGMARTTLSLDGVQLQTVSGSGPNFSFSLEVSAFSDGSHTLTIMAYDKKNQLTTVDRSVSFALAMPTAPTITSPATGSAFNQPQQFISGKALKNSAIKVFADGVAQTSVATASSAGTYTIPVLLPEGTHAIQVSASNRGGESPKSNAVNLTYDDTTPVAPTAVLAEAREAGVIRLSWRSTTETLAGFDLFRAAVPFTSIAEATKINSGLITGTVYSDSTPSDQVWYYRLRAQNLAGSNSDLSSQVSASADRQVPEITQLVFTPQGNGDLQSGVTQGRIDILLEVSEPLSGQPFFNLHDARGGTIPTYLFKNSELSFSGHFIVGPDQASGIATPSFSARDLTGNRGTAVPSGHTVLLDTKAPDLVELTVTPTTPIHNPQGTPTTITVNFRLDEAPPQGQLPEFAYALSNDPDTELPLNVSGSGLDYSASFSLPASAGEPAESLSFTYSCTDQLNNVSHKILANNFFEVYQNGLPPYETPIGLNAEAKPEGMVALNWGAVKDTSVYQIYRRAPGTSQFTLLTRVIDATTYSDATSFDGEYAYTVTSIRQANGQESESPQSSPVTAQADGTAPDAPSGLALLLASNGISATWNPSSSEPVTYRLYRDDQSDIVSLDGLVPVLVGITLNRAVDPHPSLEDHAYAVTAVDAAGNESDLSNSAYLNFQLLPIDSFTIEREDQGPLNLSWSHISPSISGYDLYQGALEADQKINQEVLVQPEFEEIPSEPGNRVYTVVAYDNQQMASPARSLLVPDVQWELMADSSLNRGIMNRLSFQVTNSSGQAFSGLTLVFEVTNQRHASEAFSLEPGASSVVDVVVGGYDTLQAVESIRTLLEYRPNEGELVVLAKSATLEVGERLFGIQVTAENFVRGGTGKVRLNLINDSPVAIDLLTATNSGNSDSSEIRFILEDVDGNLIAQAPMRQTLGEGVLTLADKRTVARVQPGGAFSSNAFELSVPANAPEVVYGKVVVDKLHYGLGTANHVAINGSNNRTEVRLIETSYTAEVTEVSPSFSFGDQPVVISGMAYERATGTPAANVPLKITLSNRGFNREIEVYSMVDGSFSYSFEPTSQEGGTFTVRASHPLLMDIPVQGSFVIGKLQLLPETYNLTIPRNYTYAFKARVRGFGDSTASDLRFDYLAEDQPNGQLLAGIFLAPTNPLSLQAGKSLELVVQLAADNSAPATGTLALRLSDGAGTRWGTLRVNYILSGIEPSLTAKPSYLETGLATAANITETVTLSNKGLDSLRDVQCLVLNEDGSAAPNWLTLSVPAGFTRLAVGESVDISLSFAPDASVPTSGTTPYGFKLQINASNAEPFEVPVYCWVDQSGTGKARIKVTDMYTGTLHPQTGSVIEGMEGAQVRLVKAEGSLHEVSAKTDSLGEIFFENLPAGRYALRVSANKRTTYQGQVWIRPGATATDSIHLDADLISVDWSVTETTVRDVYNIQLEATFETNVPTALLVAQPASISLPAMAIGDVFYGEFTLTNYGLIQAENLKFSTSTTDDLVMEILDTHAAVVKANEIIRIPYRITKVPKPSIAHKSAADCFTSLASAIVKYDCHCTNGEVSDGSTAHQASRAEGSCSYVIQPTVFGGRGASSSSGGGSGGGGQGGRDEDGEPPECTKNCKERNKKCCKKNRSEQVGSDVDLISGEFLDEETDLKIKVMGHELEILRTYEDGHWSVASFVQKMLSFSYDSNNQIQSIELKDVTYTARNNSQNSWFANDGSRIYKLADHYRWQDTLGRWEEYDGNGRLVAFANFDEVQVKLIFDAAGRFLGLRDHFDEQILFVQYNSNNQLFEIHDYTNRSVVYTYDPSGNMDTVTNVLGQRTDFTYDSAGRLSSKTYPNGRKSNIAYDQLGRVVSVLDQDNSGKYFTYAYSIGRHEFHTTVNSSSGIIKEYWFDSEGNLIQSSINGIANESEEENSVIKVVKNENGLVTLKTYPDGTTEVIQYNLRGNVQSVKTRSGLYNEYTYDGHGNLIELIEAKGSPLERRTHNNYDDYGNMTQTTLSSGDGSAASSMQFTYDNRGNLSTHTNQAAMEESFNYDVMGNTVYAKDFDGHETFTVYDALGRVTSTHSDNGPVTTHEYGFTIKNGKVDGSYQKEIFPDGSFEESRYSSWDLLVEKIARNGEVTKLEYDLDQRLIRHTVGSYSVEYVYDALGNLTRLNYPDGTHETRSYDSSGRLTHVVDEMGHTTTNAYAGNNLIRSETPTETTYNSYDGEERLIQEVIVPVSGPIQTTNFEYDLLGNVTKTDKGDGHIKTLTYDDLGRKIREVDASGDVQSYAYDYLDNLTEFHDKRGKTTRFEYDTLGRVLRVQLDSGITASTTYIGTKLETKTDFAGHVTKRTYNQAGLLSNESFYTDASSSSPEASYDYNYDESGTPIQVSNGDYITDMIYSATTGELEITNHVDGFEKKYTYTIDNHKMITDIKDPSGHSYHYQYNPRQELVAVNLSDVGEIQLSHTNLGEHKVTFPFGIETTTKFESGDRVASILTKNGQGQSLAQLLYTHNAQGLIDSLSTLDGVTNVTYDQLERITSYTSPTSSSALTYDEVGNRVSDTRVQDPLIYNDLDQLVSMGPGTSFTYDANGNVISRTENGETLFLSWNAQNCLIRISDSLDQTLARYEYDHDGLRIKKEVEGAITYFLYGANGLIAEVSETGEEIRSYIPNPTASWNLNVLAVRTNNQYHFLVNDANGSPVKAFNSAGEVTWSIDYDAFGLSSVSNSSTIQIPLRQSGQYYDAETGLHYNTFRYYDPQLGRYLSRDPYLTLPYSHNPFYHLDQQTETNLYVFAKNNPLSFSDPFGLACYFAKRPLNTKGLRDVPVWVLNNPPGDLLGCELVHEAIFFDDGKSPSSIGFGPEGLEEGDPELRPKYKRIPGNYDCCILRLAAAATPPGPYIAIGNNCQNWASRVRLTYLIMKNDPEVKEKCCKK